MESAVLQKAIDENVLKELCDEYCSKIASGEFVDYDVNIRYIATDNKFGYKPFGKFFYWMDELYVFDDGEEWREEHNGDAVEDFFGYDFDNLGYAHRVIFAGVDTNRLTIWRDKYVYTGDVAMVDNNPSRIFPVGIRGGEYAVVGTDEIEPLPKCKSLMYVGSVFYDLDWRDGLLLEDRIEKFLSEAYGNEGENFTEVLNKSQIIYPFQ